MPSRLLHLVDTTAGHDAVMLACADALTHCSRFEHAEQTVMLVAHDGLAAARRASLLGLHAHRVVSPRGAAALAVHEAISQADADDRCICIIWGGDHAAGLMMPEADAHVLVDLVRGRVHSPQIDRRGEEVARLPDDAALSLVGEQLFEETRARVRASLGVSEHTILMLPLNDPAATVDGHLLAEMAGMLAVAGTPVTLLLPRCARHVDRAVRHWREAYLPGLLLTDDPLGSFVAGADIGVLSEEAMRMPYCSFVQLRHAHRHGLAMVIPGRPGEEMDPESELSGISIARDNTAASIGRACVSLMEQGTSEHPRARRHGRTLADALRDHEEASPTIGRTVADIVGAHLNMATASL